MLCVATCAASSSGGAHRTQNFAEWQQALHAEILAMGAQHTVAAERTAYASFWFGRTDTPAFQSLRVMAHTLRRHDKLREIIVITPNANAKQDAGFASLREQAMPLSYVTVSALDPRKHSASSICQRTMDENARSRLHVNDWAKFHMWNLTRFDRVLYIDADVMVLHSLDHLWQTTFGVLQLGAAAHTLPPPAKNMGAHTGQAFQVPYCRFGTYTGFPLHQWNAGILLIRPSAAIFGHLLRTLANRAVQYTCLNGDQTPFNAVLKYYFRCLSHTYNCYHPVVLLAPNASDAKRVGTMAKCYPPEVKARALVNAASWQPRLLHMVGMKPWMGQFELSSLGGGNRANSTYYGRMWLAMAAKVRRKTKLKIDDCVRSR